MKSHEALDIIEGGEKKTFTLQSGDKDVIKFFSSYIVFDWSISFDLVVSHSVPFIGGCGV